MDRYRRIRYERIASATLVAGLQLTGAYLCPDLEDVHQDEYRYQHIAPLTVQMSTSTSHA